MSAIDDVRTSAVHPYRIADAIAEPPWLPRISFGFALPYVGSLHVIKWLPREAASAVRTDLARKRARFSRRLR